MLEISKAVCSNAYTEVSSKLNEIEDTTDNIVCTVNNLKEADVRFQNRMAAHEEKNSEAFLDIYDKIKTVSQNSEQADTHLHEELGRNEEENKVKFKRIQYVLVASGIANIISLAGLIIFYILNY